jgi:hypothetical protein
MDEDQIVAMIATILEFMDAKETTPLMIVGRYRANKNRVIEEHQRAEQRAELDKQVRDFEARGKEDGSA